MRSYATVATIFACAFPIFAFAEQIYVNLKAASADLSDNAYGAAHAYNLSAKKTDGTNFAVHCGDSNLVELSPPLSSLGAYFSMNQTACREAIGRAAENSNTDYNDPT